MIELTKDKKHVIIKRDGREEPFDEEKLKKVINWATDGKEAFADALLQGLNIKINDKMKIEALYDELINTAVNMISPLYPSYDAIAEKLYLMKIYKETAGLKKTGSYPHLKTFLKKGLKYKIYDGDILKKFSDRELDKINAMIDPDRDLLFTYKGLAIFHRKYCKSIGNKKLELPQITYMAAAMFSFYDDTHKGAYGGREAYEKSRSDRLKHIKRTYDMLSKHEVTFATPRIANSLTTKAQLASCILNTPDDDTWSLNQTDSNMALYSKFSGGIAYDASFIRASGSSIQTNRGRSDGPIPFIKRVEQTIASFNQGGCLAKDSLVEVVDSVEFTDGTIEKVRYSYRTIEQHLNKEIMDFIDSKLVDLSFPNIKITKKQLKEIWINKIKGVDRKDIIKIIPNLTFNLYKRYVAKYLNSFDFSQIKNFIPMRGFENNYLIHKDGTVINKKYGHILQQSLNKKGYIRISVSNKKSITLHTALYLSFIGEIPDNMTIDHIDNNKLNNNLNNLQLLSPKDNSDKNNKLIKSNPELVKYHRKLRLKRYLYYGYAFNGHRTIGFDSTEILKINTIQIPIEKVSTTDAIKCYNTKEQKVEFRKILGKYEFDIPVEKQYILEFENGGKLITSDHHPIFYRDENKKIKHKRTDEMKVGDLCITSNNNNIKLVSIQKSTISHRFYDLTVYGNNNYFAIDKNSSNLNNLVLVHNTRKGACVVTFPWWHMDVMDLVMLKDAGGTEDTRARKLVYSVRISNIFRERVNKDQYITLFDPKETPLLNEEFGERFDVAYVYYESKSSIRKKKIKAKDLLFQILKVRQETGNVYLTFVDNINEQNMVNKFVGASNLCQEIVIPSFPSKLIEEKYVVNEDGSYEIIQRKQSGEIGICNLVSINLMAWVNFKPEKKKSFCYTLLRGCDNIIDNQYYPVKEGEVANKKNRPIGIGVINYANLLASNKIKYTDKEALEFTNKVFDDLYYHIYEASNILAKERGPYKTFNESKWKDGKTPFHLSILNKKDILKVELDTAKWDKLAEEIKKYGVRFSFHSAIAPTATSGKSVSATESIEPIVDLFFVEEGIQTLPSLAPNLKKNRTYYERCWTIPAKNIIELAAIRQRYIDQSQSVNLYYVKPESAKELWDDIQYAMDLGLKTLYYMKTPKSNFELDEVCESCT